ncbi:hypothetical protein NBO_287g0003 [Nosema bombycis CQ1]|uniref:Uncharacterized protein n=1 Tax=Nosema bombycis (strain CQ1 / CVCC 102059) TaxID=578461 RepID=R0M4Q7_NOSB1|nr:hypothetical protein NBO_287g0003 [Nosema bombycis CQ1]|eukprot:EOB12969.1 hypothetical protein NBO_287g0003 [Nosema bombycis CQ1]
MMLIFFIIFKVKTSSTNEPTLDSYTPNNGRLRSLVHVHRSNKDENDTPINAAEFELVDINPVTESEESNCNDNKTDCTTNLINRNDKSDEQTTNSFFYLWETFSCSFVLCCLILLTLVIIASYYCYGKNERGWGLLLTMAFILSMIILGAIISGIEKLKIRNQRVY